jgi:hypothetical protein
LIELVVGAFIAGFESLLHDDVTGRASADSPAHVLQLHPIAHGDVEKTSRQTGLAIRNFPWIYLDFGDSPIRGDIGDGIWRFRKLDIGLLYIRVGSTHVSVLSETRLS